MMCSVSTSSQVLVDLSKHSSGTSLLSAILFAFPYLTFLDSKQTRHIEIDVS